MTKQKDQHWIPRSYLAAWCDPETPAGHEPYVWKFSKDGKRSVNKAPKSIFKVSDLYTLQFADGSRNLTIEHGLGGLEQAFTGLRRDKLNVEAPLDESDRLLLCSFIAAMRSRPQAVLAHFSSTWKEVRELMDDMKEAMRTASPEERRTMRMGLSSPSGEKGISYEEVAELEEEPQRMLVPMIQMQLPDLMGLNTCILSTTDDIGFITSDNPCVWYDREAHLRPFPLNSAGLGWPKIEITLPLSPRHLALLSRRELPQYLPVKDLSWVDDFNSRTRFFSHEEFIARSNRCRPAWLEGEVPPERDANAKKAAT